MFTSLAIDTVPSLARGHTCAKRAAPLAFLSVRLCRNPIEDFAVGELVGLQPAPAHRPGQSSTPTIRRSATMGNTDSLRAEADHRQVASLHQLVGRGVADAEHFGSTRDAQRQFAWTNLRRCRTPYAAAFTASSSSIPDPTAPPNVATAATNHAIIKRDESPTG